MLHEKELLKTMKVFTQGIKALILKVIKKIIKKG